VVAAETIQYVTTKRKKEKKKKKKQLKILMCAGKKKKLEQSEKGCRVHSLKLNCAPCCFRIAILRGLFFLELVVANKECRVCYFRV